MMVWVPRGDCSNSESQNEEPSPNYQLMSNSYRTLSVLLNLVLFLFRHQQVSLSFGLGIRAHTENSSLARNKCLHHLPLWSDGKQPQAAWLTPRLLGETA